MNGLPPLHNRIPIGQQQDIISASKHGALAPVDRTYRQSKEDVSHRLNISSAPLAEIVEIQFGLLDPNEARRFSNDRITTYAIKSKSTPALHSINSPLLGPSDRSGNSSELTACCHLPNCECDGPFGVCELAYPMYHTFMLNDIVKTLNAICCCCARVLVTPAHSQYTTKVLNESSPETRRQNLAQMANNIQYCSPEINRRRKSKKVTPSTTTITADSEALSPTTREAEIQLNKELLEHEKQLQEEALKYEFEMLEQSGCCGAIQYNYKHKDSIIYRTAKATNNDFSIVCDTVYRVTQAMVLDLFERVTEVDMVLLGFDPEHSPPSRMLHQVIMVPPNCLRLAQGFNQGTRKQRSENPFSKKLADQVYTNEKLRLARVQLILGLRQQKQKQQQQQRVSSETEEISQISSNSRTNGKQKATLAPLLKNRGAQNKAAAQKRENDLQLDLQNDQLVVGQSFRSGHPDIDDIEWANFLETDAALFDETFYWIKWVQFAMSSYHKADVHMPKQTAGKKQLIRLSTSKQSIDLKVKGKTGHVRGSMNAKKTECSARGVIIPDSTLDIDEIGVPQSVAVGLQVPEEVTPVNLEAMRRLVLNGTKVYPGAKYLMIPTKLIEDDAPPDAKVEPEMHDLDFADRYYLANVVLRPGMVVHRHLVNNDPIEFNRQPSLHKYSFMDQRARVVPGSCFRMNPQVCKPYGADFDGDAAVAHLLQSLQSRIESRMLLHISQQIMTCQTSTPHILPIQDLVLGCFQLTHDDILMTDRQFCNYIGKARYLLLEPSNTYLAPSLRVRKAQDSKYVHLFRSGKELFSRMLPDKFDFCRDFQVGVAHMNDLLKQQTRLEIEDDSLHKPKLRSYESLDDLLNEVFFTEPHKQPVLILNRCMLRGVIRSNIIQKIVHLTLHRYGQQTCLRFESDLRIIDDWLADFGFSVGPNDCVVKNHTELRKILFQSLQILNANTVINMQEIMDDDEKVDEKMLKDESTDETLKIDVEDRVVALKRQRDHKRESIITSLLGQLTIFMMNQVKDRTTGWNRFWQMMESGAKGKPFHLLHIMMMLGQVEIEGKRLEGYQTAHFLQPDVVVPEELKHLIPHDKLLAKGFITESFTSGLTPIQNFQHMRAGRTGVADATVHTSDAGYIGRLLFYHLNTSTIRDDLSVRDAAGNVLQLLYGNDGFDAKWLLEVELKMLEYDNQQMKNEFLCEDELIDLYLWPLEQSAWSDSSHRFNQLGQFLPSKEDFYSQGVQQLKYTIRQEFERLLEYRDRLRKARLHYPTNIFNITFMLPVDVFDVVRSAQQIQQQRRRIMPHDPTAPKLTPTLTIRAVHACVERLYGHYPGVYNRLWAFEAVVYSVLCVKNVLFVFGLDYVGLEYVLAEMEARFSRTLAHSKELVGALAAQMVSEMNTQNSLNQHRVAGSGAAAADDAVSTSLFKEIITMSKDPSNPRMRLYTVAFTRLFDFMTRQEIETVILNNKKIEEISEEDKQHLLAMFIKNQLERQTLEQVSLGRPTVLKDFVQEASWVKRSMMVLSKYEQELIYSRASTVGVIRFLIDYERLEKLNLDINDLLILIRLMLKESEEPSCDLVDSSMDEEEYGLRWLEQQNILRSARPSLSSAKRQSSLLTKEQKKLAKAQKKAAKAQKKSAIIENKNELVDVILSNENDMDVDEFLDDIDGTDAEMVGLDMELINDTILSIEEVDGVVEQPSEENIIDDQAVFNKDTILRSMISPIQSCNGRNYKELLLFVSPASKQFIKLSKTPKLSKRPDMVVSCIMHWLYANTLISGIDEISYASIEKETHKEINHESGELLSKSEWVVYTRGSNVIGAFSCPFVDQRRSSTTHLIETNQIYGMDSGTNANYYALMMVLQSSGSRINERHVQQVVTGMCHRGYYVQVSSQGINSVRDFGPLHRASFEDVMPTFVKAAMSGEKDRLIDQTGNAMVGKLLPIGTGGVDVRLQDSQENEQTIDPELKQSHMKWLSKQVVPTLNDMDVRVMLYNSGEERVHGGDGSVLSSEHQDYELVMKQHQRQTNDDYRGSSLDSSLAIVPGGRTLEQESVYRRQLLADREVATDNDDPLLNTIEFDINQKREEARRRHQEKLSIRLCQSDHLTVRVKQRKEPSEHKQTRKYNKRKVSEISSYSVDENNLFVPDQWVLMTSKNQECFIPTTWSLLDCKVSQSILTMDEERYVPTTWTLCDCKDVQQNTISEQTIMVKQEATQEDRYIPDHWSLLPLKDYVDENNRLIVKRFKLVV